MVKRSQQIIESTFVLDGNSVSGLEHSHVFGLAIVGDRAYTNCDIDDDLNINPRCCGAFIAVLIDSVQGEVRIIQDALATYPLFVYRDGTYNCISNSFWDLCDYVKYRHPLSFNKDYAFQLLSTGLAPLSASGTLAKEITIAPILSTIHLGQNGELRIESLGYELGSTPLDSRQGMAKFDAWLDNWISIVSSIGAQYPIDIDLTGGRDSRVVFSLVCAGLREAGIPFNANNISVKSWVSQCRGIQEHIAGDFETAKLIGEMLGFEVNDNELAADYVRVSGEYAFEIAKQTFLGFHREAYFRGAVCKSPRFHFGGYLGEPVRHKTRSLEQWCSLIRNPVQVNPKVLAELVLEWERYQVQSRTPRDAARMFYLSTWARSHYGGMILQLLFEGSYALSPCSDFTVYEIQIPEGLGGEVLFALAIQRACPELLMVPFSDGTCFSQDLIDYVRRLDRKYKRVHLSDRPIIDFSMVEQLDAVPNSDNGVLDSAEACLSRIVADRRNKELFIDEFGGFGTAILDYAQQFFDDKDNFHHENWLMAIAGIEEFLRIADNAERKKTASVLSKAIEQYPGAWQLPKALNSLMLLCTARLDIKLLAGKDCNLEFQSVSDSNAVVSKPSWFQDASGAGGVIQSSAGSLLVVFKCTHDGSLSFALRSPDVKDRDGKRAPIYIEYTRFVVDGEEVLSHSVSAWHDDPFWFSRKAEGGSTVHVFLEWNLE